MTALRVSRIAYEAARIFELAEQQPQFVAVEELLRTARRTPRSGASQAIPGGVDAPSIVAIWHDGCATMHRPCSPRLRKEFTTAAAAAYWYDLESAPGSTSYGVQHRIPRQHWAQGSRTTSAVLRSPCPPSFLLGLVSRCSSARCALHTYLPHSCRAPTHDVSLPLLPATSLVSDIPGWYEVPCLASRKAGKSRPRRGSSELASMNPAKFAGAVSEVVERFPRRDVRPRGHVNRHAAGHYPPRAMLPFPLFFFFSFLFFFCFHLFY